MREVLSAGGRRSQAATLRRVQASSVLQRNLSAFTLAGGGVHSSTFQLGGRRFRVYEEAPGFRLGPP